MLSGTWCTRQAGIPRHLPSLSRFFELLSKIQCWARLLVWIRIPRMETNQSVDSIYYVMAYNITPPRKSSTLQPIFLRKNHLSSLKLHLTKPSHLQCTHRTLPKPSWKISSNTSPIKAYHTPCQRISMARVKFKHFKKYMAIAAKHHP